MYQLTINIFQATTDRTSISHMEERVLELYLSLCSVAGDANVCREVGGRRDADEGIGGIGGTSPAPEWTPDKYNYLVKL